MSEHTITTTITTVVDTETGKSVSNAEIQAGEAPLMDLEVASIVASACYLVGNRLAGATAVATSPDDEEDDDEVRHG